MSARIAVLVLVAAGWCAAVGVGPASAQDVKSAEAFIRRVYAPYKANGSPPDLTGPAAETILTPSLAALLRTDEAALKDEVGVLDGDPICACQDFDIRAVNVAIVPAGPGRAKATARFKNFGKDSKVEFDLVALKGGWRVDDIHEDELPSLRHALEGEIAESKTKVAR